MNYDQILPPVMALLDREYPGWPDDVSLRELDMGNASYMPGECSGCVAAQVGYHRHGESEYGYDLVLEHLADRGGLSMGEISLAFGADDDLEAAWRRALAPIKQGPQVAV